DPMLSTERVSVFQLVTGFFGFLNALVASLQNAEKSSHLDLYINTHWITTIVVFAGASRLLMINSWPAEIFSLMLQLLCFCITVNAMVADFWNLRLLSAINGTTIPTSTTISHLQLYSSVDAILCVTAVLLSSYIIYQHFFSSAHLYHQTPSVKLLGMGTALVMLGVVRFACYFCEFFKLAGQDRLRALFANYTLDEPAWICTQLALGVLCVISSRGSKLLRALTLALAASTLMPSVFYLWLDYRWWASSRLSFGLVSTSSAYWQAAGVAISLCNVGVVTATLIQLLSMHSASRRITLDEKTKRFLIIVAAIFLVLSCSTISLDVYTIWKKLFYRLFHGAEQKTPFLTALTAIFTLAASGSKFAPIALPACLILSLYSLNSTIFQLISYMYLSWNGYFGDQLCELFFPGLGRCFLEVTKTEAAIHFVQVLLDFFVLILSSILCGCSIRITTMAKTEATGNRRLESPIRWLGVLMALCGLAVLVQAVAFFRTSTDLHPMVVVYMALYHMALAIGLIVFPLYQILCSEKLSINPLSQTSLLILSVVRFVEILSQLDYRGTGDDLSFAWKVHQIADFVSLTSHFVTALLVIRLMGNDTEEADELQLQFNNPLTLESNGDYSQLRPQEDS
uniref:GPI ethanolamine phosphate transferase 2 n=1 Tax=Haemonchus contortus TaxID=6289 RepID=A0A7I4Y7Y3_HAECO